MISLHESAGSSAVIPGHSAGMPMGGGVTSVSVVGQMHSFGS